MISLFGIQFHWYGLIVGMAVVTGLYLIEFRHLLEQKERKIPLSVSQLWQVLVIGILGGVVGARLWHVMTDWQLYQENGLAAFYIWNGGMSILGALGGGFLSAWFWLLVQKKLRAARYFFDLLVFGLPVGQALGRLGNWINQELYGLPTNLPWRLYISPAARLPGYQEDVYYHPLFAYEALLTGGFGLALWWLYWQRPVMLPRLGTGIYTLIYLVYYAGIRFFLDFLRIDKSYWEGTSIGINQVVLGVIFIGTVGFLIWKMQNKYHNEKTQAP